MNWTQLKRQMVEGLWTQNAGLVQILGLCPVLAVSTTIVNGVSLGLATTLVMTLSGFFVALVRKAIPRELRNPLFILIIATLVTIVDLSMKAYLHELYIVLGIFVPLIVTNCIVLARAEAFASKHTWFESALDGFWMGLGLTLVLAMLGGLRELIGQGTLLSGIEMLLGEQAKMWAIHPIPDEYHYQFLLAILPPGAFFILAFLIAGHTWLKNKF